MDEEYQQRSSWSYDNNNSMAAYNDFNNNHNDGGFSNHNHNHRSSSRYQDDSFNGTGSGFSHGRKRQFSHEYVDSCAKLYVRGVPREVTEQDIRSIFGKHGNIIEVVLFKELKSLHEQECCFVKYAKIEEADQAIRALHNHHTFPGGMRPIEVKYASKKPERPGCMRTHEYKVFVGSMNKQASIAEITEIFSPYGCVEDVFLLRDEHKQKRGMGFISYPHKDMAVAAINALNGKYVMKGCDQPLVVRFADPKKPKTGEYRSAPYVNDPVGRTSHPNGSHMSSQTGSDAPPSVSSTCSVPTTSSEMSDPGDCDWSEHICPDGNAYYYNCVTCESRWEKPDEYRFHEQQLQSAGMA
ncbi:hypothetical protein OSB04_020285 [Centaurea solstitialis]|uniref:Uncharacterized protein n=1 Tax=Centaurea solstitialis TaxID=347529 RepID=A0AA38W5R4_9ASTR|nr:hypothetical protein OSB04_020285 [Centaurea solstitialis]